MPIPWSYHCRIPKVSGTCVIYVYIRCPDAQQVLLSPVPLRRDSRYMLLLLPQGAHHVIRWSALQGDTCCSHRRCPMSVWLSLCRYRHHDSWPLYSSCMLIPWSYHCRIPKVSGTRVIYVYIRCPDAQQVLLSPAPLHRDSPDTATPTAARCSSCDPLVGASR